jgi:hypothetical protein
MAGPGIFFLCEQEVFPPNSEFNDCYAPAKWPGALYRVRNAAGAVISMNIQRKDFNSPFAIVRVRRDPKGRPEGGYLALVEAIADDPTCVRVCNDTDEGLAKTMDERPAPVRARLRKFATDYGIGTLPADLTSAGILDKAAATLGCDWHRGPNAAVSEP